MSLFWFSLSLSMGMTGAKRKLERTVSPDFAETQKPNVDVTEAELSAEAQKLQQDLRKRAHQLDNEADAESLYWLEVATAANSDRARLEDRKSLEVLVEATKGRHPVESRVTVGTKHDYFPRSSRLKGLNGSPLSYAPSFSTPSSENTVSKTPSSRNEFEEFLAKDAAARKESSMFNATKSRLNTPAKTARPQNTQGSISHSQRSLQARGQIAEVLSWFDAVEQRDNDGDLNHLTASTVVSPLGTLKTKLKQGLENGMEFAESPTASIKHLPKNYGLSIRKRFAASDNGNGNGNEDGEDPIDQVHEAQDADDVGVENDEAEEEAWDVV